MANADLLGIHHVTAMTDDVQRNYEFITHVLGMRLVKKTVNQDDIQTYHTFYADDRGTPGTDLTFFDFPDIPSYVPEQFYFAHRIKYPMTTPAYYLERFRICGRK